MNRMVFGRTAHLVLIVCVQFLFVSWGNFAPFMPSAYLFMHEIMVLVGALGVIKANSADVILLYFIMNLISVLNDIILLALYEPAVRNQGNTQMGDTYRFSLGMVIVNLLLKPLVAFLLYCIYTARGGNFKDFIRSLLGRPEAHAGYDDIDSESRTETASPHHRVDE